MTLPTNTQSLRALLLVLAGSCLTACPTTLPVDDAGPPGDRLPGDAGVLVADGGPVVDPAPDAPPTGEPDAGSIELPPIVCQDAADYCSALYECGSEERLTWERQRYWHRDVLDCMAIMKPIFDVACDALVEAVEAGTTVLDREALAACRHPRRSCEETIEDAWPFDRCGLAPIATGGVGINSPCTWDHECGVGLSCNTIGDHLPGDYFGTCEPLPDAGEACKPGRCAGELTCVDAVCVDLEVPLLTACIGDDECGPNLRCDQPGNDFRVDVAGDVEGQCRPRVGLGAPCDAPEACSPGLACASEQADADGYRLPGSCIVPRAAGEACNHPDDCESLACLDGLCG